MRQVAILIETSRAYGRGLLRGVARFNSERGGWSTYFQPHGIDDPPPKWLKDWQGDGILARIDNRRMADAVLKANVPVVNLRHTVADLDLPFIGADNLGIAKLAFEHLAVRGLRRFAFCGIPIGQHPAMDLRREHFVHIVRKAGFPCETLLQGGRSSADWEQEQAELGEWIAALAKPVGIMACNDDRGLRVLDAARRIGAMVPDEVAVISVENDEHLCGLAIPPLTSIDMNAERIGYEAAVLLDRLMSGRKPPKRIRPIQPLGVVARRSTDVLAVEDPAVARAVRFIRENACRGIQLKDVIAAAGCTRASLAPRFRRLIGRSIHQEIQRMQVERAKELLIGSDLSIKRICQLAGFRYVQYFTRLFRLRVGTTPARFRSDSRVG